MVKAEDGVNYCVPVSGFYEGMFVNKDLFDEYGLELPTDWDKFMRQLRHLQIRISYRFQLHLEIFLIMSSNTLFSQQVV